MISNIEMQNLWDGSFESGFDNILYPKEPLIRFINRKIRKQISLGKFQNILKGEDGGLRALDFGCGTGRQALFMSEFGIDSYGLDISEVAINEAKKLSREMKIGNQQNFSCYGGGANIPFSDNFFDLTISCGGVLGCIPKENLPCILREIARITKTYCFFVLIEARPQDNRGFEPLQIRFNQETINEYFSSNFVFENIEKETLQDLSKNTETITYNLTLKVKK